MSSAGRTPGLRSANDTYITPPWAVHRLLESEHAASFKFEREGGKQAYWLDPCAAHGQLISAAEGSFKQREVATGRRANVRWTACEIRPECEDALKRVANPVVIGDFLHVVPASYDVVLTNPPYSLAEEFVLACLPIAERVAMLLRVNWIAGHGALLKQHPADVLVLPDRPSFALNKEGKVGSDSTEYAWFVFGPGPRTSGSGIIDVLGETPVEVRSAYRRELFERLTRMKEAA